MTTYWPDKLISCSLCNTRQSFNTWLTLPGGLFSKGITILQALNLQDRIPNVYLSAWMFLLLLILYFHHHHEMPPVLKFSPLSQS